MQTLTVALRPSSVIYLLILIMAAAFFFNLFKAVFKAWLMDRERDKKRELVEQDKKDMTELVNRLDRIIARERQARAEAKMPPTKKPAEEDGPTV